MSGTWLILIILIALISMVILIAKYKAHPFIVMILVTYFLGLTNKIPVNDIFKTIQEGFGGIMGNIGIVIIAGTIIGTILEKTGAALTMANTILKIVGKDKAVMTMSLTGYVTGIPVFCDSGFVILSPINRALASKSNISLAVMATALSSGLYATHCLVPPTPGPIIMADTLSANLGLVILVGLITSIPVMIAGYLYATRVTSKIDIPANPTMTVDKLIEKYGELPSPAKSFTPIVLPIVLIALKSIADFPSEPLGAGLLKNSLDFLGHPITALLLGTFFALSLIPEQEKKNKFNWISDGITNSASILAITGAGGALGAMLKSLPIADLVSGSLLKPSFGVFAPFLIAMLLKTAMGASTVAMIVTSAMVAPMMGQMGMTSEIAKALVVMAIGAGSMTVSHPNDSYFWVVSQFSDMDIKTAYKCQTGVTLVEGVTAIIFISIVATIFL